MRPIAKVGIVVGGYALAFIAACAVMAAYVALTSGPDRQNYAGMFAFGDGLLFLGVFALAAVPATVAGLFFLRPFRSFWIALSVLALSIAATGLASMAVYIALRHVPPNDPHSIWSAVAVLRVLIAPCFALGFLVAAAVAPGRGSRAAFLVSFAAEGVTYTPFVLMWFQASFLR
jgi:hypothetical protein